METSALKELFEKEFPEVTGELNYFFAPGRVNLIGEHIDYNGGYVFPAALSLGMFAAVRFRDDNVVRLRSENASAKVDFEISKDIVYDKKDDWANYPKGIVKYLLNEGYELKGCDVVLTSTIPKASGLSSSAALEIISSYIMLYPTLGDKQDRVYLSKLSQKVENEFVGVNCGIMDQFSVAVGKKDNAILLDCSTLNYKYAPFILDGSSLVIMNTNKKRELADSKYNERRSECDTALAILNKYRKVENLCSANIEDIESYINDETVRKRAKHAVLENKRVLDAVKVLEEGKIEEFGKLLNASHASLKNDYEVTGFELDTMVEEAQKQEGCLGARMTGAGFGGCAIAIVKNENIDAFTKNVGKVYEEKTGIKPAFYVSVIGDGVKAL